jgi:MFS transporter, DHA2 family, methylenomycin A resistance protein
MALLTICLGYFMVILDTMVVNVAVPSLGHDLHAGVSALQWVVAGYTLVFAGLLLSGGTLGDRMGPKRVLRAGLAVFTLASAACALAPTAGFLIAARLAQGAGAALFVPASLMFLQALYAEPRRRAHAFGLWGGVAGVAAASGPIVGGLLIAGFGWRSVFLVNVPIGLLTLVGVRRLPDVPGRRRQADILGQILGIATLAALTAALIETSALAGVAAVVLAAAFFYTERRVPVPMLPLVLLRSRPFAAGSVVGLLINLGFYGQLFVTTLYFQDLRGYSALNTGLLLLPESAMASVGSILSGRIMSRTGPWPPMVAGLALGAAGLLGLVAAAPHTAYGVLVVPLAAAGLGMSLTMPAATAAVMGSAPAEHAGLASGVVNTARQVGGVIGVALLGTLVAHRASFPAGLRVSMLIAACAFAIACTTAISQVKRGRRILQDHLPQIRTSGYLRRSDDRFWWQQFVGSVVRLGFPILAASATFPAVPVHPQPAGWTGGAIRAGPRWARTTAAAAPGTHVYGARGRGRDCRRHRGRHRLRGHQGRQYYADDGLSAQQRFLGAGFPADRDGVPAGVAVWQPTASGQLHKQSGRGQGCPRDVQEVPAPEEAFHICG